VPAPSPRTAKRKPKRKPRKPETLWVRNDRTGRAREHRVLPGSRKRGDAIICPLPLGEDADWDGEPWTVAYPRPDIEWGHTFYVGKDLHTVSRFELEDDKVTASRRAKERAAREPQWWEEPIQEPDFGRMLREALAKKFDTDAIVETLGLKTWPASRSQIRNAYRHKAKILHPDRGGDAKAFAELTAAKETALKICLG